MQLAPIPSFAALAIRMDDGQPIQPEIGSIRYTYLDGTSREFRIRPFINDPSDFAEHYASIRDAKAAINEYNVDLLGMAFGVFQVEAGAFAIRPLESERGIAFVIDGDAMEARVGHGSADADSNLVGIVGLDSWIDLTDPTKRTHQPVVRFPAG